VPNAGPIGRWTGRSFEYPDDYADLEMAARAFNMACRIKATAEKAGN
jgi:hypothetical protein